VNLLLDTNVLLAAFIAHGTCAELLEYCARNHTLIASEYVLQEFTSKLVKKFGFSSREAAQTARLIRERAHVVVPSKVEPSACPDPDDLPILGTAVAGHCRCLVTGDEQLLKMRHYRAIDVVSPDAFWRYEGEVMRGDAR
jgi:putative PIN family toxin of toxin-antitoxin system